MENCLVVAGHRAPCRGHVERTVDDLLHLVRGLVVRHDVGVVAQIMDDGVGHHLMVGQCLADCGYLEHTDPKLLEGRIVQILDGDAPVAAVGENERGAVQGRKQNRSLRIRRHVHPQIAVALAQGGAHQAAFDRWPPIILHAGAEGRPDHLRYLVFESLALLIGQRHVSRIGAHGERLEFGAHRRAAGQHQSRDERCSRDPPQWSCCSMPVSSAERRRTPAFWNWTRVRNEGCTRRLQFKHTRAKKSPVTCVTGQVLNANLESM